MVPGGPQFPIAIGNDIIMTLFLATWLSNLDFVELRIDYQLAKFQCCRLSVASLIDGLRKDNVDVVMVSFHVVGILKSQIL